MILSVLNFFQYRIYTFWFTRFFAMNRVNIKVFVIILKTNEIRAFYLCAMLENHLLKSSSNEIAAKSLHHGINHNLDIHMAERHFIITITEENIWLLLIDFGLFFVD